MNLETTYLGLPLRNPLVVGASPLCDHVATCLALQEAGAGALVMRSLFEEQIGLEQKGLLHAVELPAESNPEASSYFPAYASHRLTPDQYLRQIQLLKKALTIPVIASLNGSGPGGWISYARRFEDAGADAIELNLYELVTDGQVSAEAVEAGMVETVRRVVHSVRIPVAVKISAFHTSPAHFALALERAGAAGIVLMNRFYQPDLDIEDLAVVPQLTLSDSAELRLRLRWLAILAPQLQHSLAVTGGVHQPADVVKSILCGAHAVQVVSALLARGPGALSGLLSGLKEWMAAHDYQDVAEFRGAMDLSHCPDRSAYERANYMKVLQSWKV
jgi:dihydroorotate dehydrogenase (fumarate)